MQNQKGLSFLAIIMVITFVAVIGTAGYFSYQYYLETKQQPNQIVCTQEAKQCPDGSYVSRIGPDCEFAECPAITDETADWKTYKNDEYGFEIKYPVAFNSNELTLTFGKSVPSRGTNLFINEKASVSSGTIIPLSLSFDVFPTTIADLEKYVKDKVASGTTFHEKWNKEHPSDPIRFDFTYSKITVGNTIGYVGRYKFLDSGQDNMEIFIQDSKNLIRIGYDSSSNDKVKVIQKMLSTFKFTK